MKALASVYKKYNDTLAEIERLQQKDVTLEAEEKSILGAASLEDPNTFKRVSDIRLMRELIPRKVTQLEASLVQQEGELKAEIISTSKHVIAICTKETAELREAIQKALRGFASDLGDFEKLRWEDLLDEVMQLTDTYRNRLVHLSIHMGTFDNYHTPAAEGARQLLALCERFKIS